MSRSVKLTDELVDSAEIHAKAQTRSVNKQVEHWARLGRLAEQNPDLPAAFLSELLIGIEEAKAGVVSDYTFG